MKLLLYKSLLIYFLLILSASEVFSLKIDTCSNNRVQFIPIKKIIFVEPSGNVEISKEEFNDLLSIKNVLQVAGIPFTNITMEKLKTQNLKNYDIIIVPYASSKDISNENILRIKDAVDRGAGIFFDGPSTIKNLFALNLQPSLFKVKSIQDLIFNKTSLYWPYSDKISCLDTANMNYTVIAVDEKSNLPLMVNGSSGKGKYIYFANLFDPYTDKGYTRYPFLIELFNSVFGTINLAERKMVEMYYDPGMSVFPINYDELAKKWKRQMIKTIYAGGWYYDDENIDYASLLKACHENGILVYCWLEPPMISEKFWKEHKEWREKTASLRDAHVDWRYLMNLSDTLCRKEIFTETSDMLLNYDWDGINMAELYFDPIDDGREDYINLTPMNTTSRSEFKGIYGFDPLLLFDSSSTHYWKISDADWMKFIFYRKDLCFRLKTYYLDFLFDINKQKNNFNIMLTAIDVSLSPLTSDYIGEDFKNTLALYEKYPITLQIEDPANCWGLTPERYDKLGKYYCKYIKDTSRLVFDCNVVASHEEGYGGFPSEKPTGEEIRQIVYNMSLTGITPAFYSEDAFYPGDFKNISATLARETKITVLNDSTWKIITPYPVEIHTGIKDNLLYLDNKPWRAGEDDKVIIPMGKHILTGKTLKQNEHYIRLNSISGNLESAEFQDKAITFTYSELFTSCFAIVNKIPSSIYIDDVKTNSEILQNSSSGYSIKLPKGKHRVMVICD